MAQSLRERRESLGLTQEELAQRAETTRNGTGGGWEGRRNSTIVRAGV